MHSEHGADEIVQTHGGGTVVSTLQELLDSVDVVFIATPTFTHADIARRALEAGKHIITEKPVTLTNADAQDLLRLAHQTDRHVYPAHVVRYFPEYVRLKAAVDAGRLGDLAVLRFARSGSFPTRTAWFADPELSGGIIMDQMIHDLDIARWVAGEVTTVSATSVRTGNETTPIEAAHVLLTHESGAISHVAGVWGAAHLEFTTEYSVAGTLGTLTHSSARERNYTTDYADLSAGAQLTPATDPAASPYFLELQEFVTAIQGGSQPRVTLSDGVAAVRIANAALESLRTGQPVDLASERSFV